MDNNGAFLLQFTGTPGSGYQLLRATAVNGPWATLSTLIAPASGRID